MGTCCSPLHAAEEELSKDPLSKEELLKAVFEKMDANGNGTLDVAELKRALGPEQGGKAAFDWLDQARDGKTDGKVTLDEFMTGQLKAFPPQLYTEDDVTNELKAMLRAVTHRPLLNQVFVTMDANRNGTLDAAELRRALGPEQGGKAAFEWLDQVRDGKITLDEFTTRQLDAFPPSIYTEADVKTELEMMLGAVKKKQLPSVPDAAGP